MPGHFGNAHEADGAIALDGVRYGPAQTRAMWAVMSGAPVTGPAGVAAATGTGALHRWTLDLDTGHVTCTPLDDRAVEFPGLDDTRVGRAARFRYAVAGGGPPSRAAVVKYDLLTGAASAHELGRDVVAGEAVFVSDPAPGRAEDDGWLLSICTRRDGSVSQLLVLGARDLAAAPVATVALPRGVPAGFHGTFVADADLTDESESESESHLETP